MSSIIPPGGWSNLPSVLPPSFCGNCGREVAAGKRFCTGCGQPVESVPAQAQPRQQWMPSVQPQTPVYVQPNVSQHVTIVQGGSRLQGSGCLWLFLLLCFPLWPITIPILLVIWIVGLFTDTQPVTYYGSDAPLGSRVRIEGSVFWTVAVICLIVAVLIVWRELVSSARNLPIADPVSFSAPAVGPAPLQRRQSTVDPDEPARTEPTPTETTTKPQSNTVDYPGADNPPTLDAAPPSDPLNPPASAVRR